MIIIPVDITNATTAIQNSSTSMSVDTFENISKKRRMNESSEMNEKNQESSSKVLLKYTVIR